MNSEKRYLTASLSIDLINRLRIQQLLDGEPKSWRYIEKILEEHLAASNKKDGDRPKSVADNSIQNDAAIAALAVSDFLGRFPNVAKLLIVLNSALEPRITHRVE